MPARPLVPHRYGRRRLGALVATLALALGLGGVHALPATAAPACVDLRVELLRSEPNAPLPGQDVQFLYRLQNAGTCATPPLFTLQLRPSSDEATWGPYQQAIDLGPGQTSELSVIYYRYGASGDYNASLVVDPGNVINETDESNNTAYSFVTVRDPLLDLTVGDVRFDPVRPVRGRPMKAIVTVHNRGTTPAPAFTVAWKPAWYQDYLHEQAGPVDGGASTTVTFSYTYPTYWNFDSVVEVDSAKVVPEEDETNNIYRFQVPVDPARPDLVVQGMHLSPSNPSPGQSTTARFVVKNAGNTAATKFRVQWQPWSGAPVQSKEVAGLAAGATTTVPFTYAFPAADVFQGSASVDPGRLVPEIDEANNGYVVTVPVAPYRTNLKVEAEVRNLPTYDQPKVDVTVTNTGNTASGAFAVDWDPDVEGVLGTGDRTVRQLVDSLGRGQKKVLTFTYAYPVTGGFMTRAVVDADDRVVELTSTDNAAQAWVYAHAPVADLEVTRFDLGASRPRIGEATTATIRVKNAGTAPAGAFTVRWGLPGAKDVRSSVPGLAPGESRTLTLAGLVGPAGPGRTTAVVDVDHQVGEGRRGERNNVATRRLTVAAAQR
jgi:subtilase family serine protease